MTTQDIKGAGFPSSVSSVQQAESTRPATANAPAPVSETARTGIYNVQSAEGRQAIQKTLLDLGLTMPEFLSGADSKFIANLPQQAKDGLVLLGQSAAALTSSGSNATPAATADLQGRWADFVAGQSTTGFMDINSLVQFVLREAYMENTKDLHFYAQKVRFYNELKKNIREELTQARKMLSTKAGMSDTDSNGASTPVTWQGEYHNSQNGGGPVDFPTEPELDPVNGMTPKPAVAAAGLADNKEGLETYIKNLEEKLNSVGDDAQLANVDLQNMLQKQQQTLQMMSNISKMLHDTAMAIIRKIGS